MTKLNMLSGLFLFVSLLCLLGIYIWPTRDWMGGPLIGLTIYMPVIIIESILFFVCLLLQRWQRLIVSVQGILAVGCMGLLIIYIANHPQ